LFSQDNLRCKERILDKGLFLQLYQQKPKVLTSLTDSESKNCLLRSLAAEFVPTEDTGKILQCSRIPYCSGGKQQFYKQERAVIILTTTNPGEANKSYVVTPIFSGPQTAGSFPILTKPELGNLENDKAYVEVSSPLANGSSFLDLNFIFTYKMGTTWIHPETLAKAPVFKDYAEHPRLIPESAILLCDMVKNKLTSKIVLEGGSENFSDSGSAPPDFFFMDGIEAVFDDWSDDESVGLEPLAATDTESEVEWADVDEDIEWKEEEPSPILLDFTVEWKKQQTEELQILRTSVVDGKGVYFLAICLSFSFNVCALIQGNENRR
jgi:hypothetical protein